MVLAWPGALTTLMPTYYPDAVNPRSAVPVTVESAGTTDGVAITMQVTVNWTLTGIVVDPAGRPQARVIVSYAEPSVQTDNSMRANLKAVRTNADGTFQIPGLRPGVYRLTPLRSPGTRVRLTTDVLTAGLMGNPSTVQVEVRDGDVSNVRIVLLPDR